MSPDEALAAAAGAVRHDLESTGRWSPATQRALGHALDARRWWVAEWPDGAEHVPGLVAQDVQEAVHEQVDPDWPRCAEHGDHALFIEPDLGPDPFWVCHRTGLPVAAVGTL
jgi:hypothetical protein